MFSVDLKIGFASTLEINFSIFAHRKFRIQISPRLTGVSLGTGAVCRGCADAGRPKFCCGGGPGVRAPDCGIAGATAWKTCTSSIGSFSQSNAGAALLPDRLERIQFDSHKWTKRTGSINVPKDKCGRRHGPRNDNFLEVSTFSVCCDSDYGDATNVDPAQKTKKKSEL